MKNDQMVQFFFNNDEIVKKAYQILNKHNLVSSFCMDKATHKTGIAVDILTYTLALDTLLKSNELNLEDKTITLHLENVRKN